MEPGQTDAHLFKRLEAGRNKLYLLPQLFPLSLNIWLERINSSWLAWLQPGTRCPPSQMFCPIWLAGELAQVWGILMLLQLHHPARNAGKKARKEGRVISLISCLHADLSWSGLRHRPVGGTGVPGKFLARHLPNFFATSPPDFPASSQNVLGSRFGPRTPTGVLDLIHSVHN